MKILYEDNHIISVVKEPGILSQADSGTGEDIVNLLKEDIKERYQKPGNVYVGLVHRLDRNVGGTMIFAKTSKGASRLSEEIRCKRFYKAYIALVEGCWPEKESLLKDYLLKDEKTNTVSDNREKGKESYLRVIRLAANDKYSLLLALPITGRTHQIRAQLSFAGYPIAGDRKYGSHFTGKTKEDFGLWSCHGIVKHPTKDELIHVTSLPERKGVWSNFDESQYEKAANFTEEKIIKWFTI